MNTPRTISVNCISSATAAAQSVTLSHLTLDHSGCYWLQTQPAQSGRITLMQHHQVQTREILPAGYSIRSRVHEYGGGAYTLRADTLVFSNEGDQRLYRFDLRQQTIQAITPELTSYRYGDLQLDPAAQRVFCVREQMQADGEPIADLISIDLQPPHGINILHQGCDFYSSPRISNDGAQLCWISWDHPDMPWDQTTLWHAALNTQGQALQPAPIKIDNASIVQPRWSPDHQLYFVADHNNWWNIYRYADGKIHPVHADAWDYAKPPWIFGLSTYSFISSQYIVCCHTEHAAWVLSLLDVHTGQQQLLTRDFAEISYLQADAHQVLFIGAREDSSQSIQFFDIPKKSYQTLFQLPQPELEIHHISRPQAFTYNSSEGNTGHAIFYPPAIKTAKQPPLLVVAHGGPTSQFERAFDIKIQFWTLRGFAVCAVNYAGSSGYGRRYRKRLENQWGILDVEDCIAAAQQLINNAEVDAERIAIRGSSAGGYTVLAALCFHSFFHAGVSYYGISDMARLYQETHKFESHYIDRLIGRYPEDAALFQQRSPASHYSLINSPVLFLQGGKDRIVPPNQAQLMYQALRDRDIQSELVIFKNEGHGFCEEKNIAEALQRELSFYQQVFRLTE